jgi:hypothetical protein
VSEKTTFDVQTNHFVKFWIVAVYFALHTHKYYNITPYLPLKVVMGSIILLSYFAAVS